MSDKNSFMENFNDPEQYKWVKATAKSIGTKSLATIGWMLKVFFIAVVVMVAYNVMTSGSDAPNNIELTSINEQMENLKSEDAQPAADLPDDAGKIYVISFNGDTMISTLDRFSKEIEMVIANADPKKDKCYIRLDSPGGAVTRYGKAASQLARLKTAGIHTTAFVNEYAASGGYLMAVVCDEIVAEPFSIVGSIGVVAGMFNFAGILEDNGIEYLIFTAGKHKRTVTQFKKPTKEGIEKYKEQLAVIHEQFKAHVKKYRPTIDIDAVATGDYWLADYTLTKDMKLVDRIGSYEDQKLVDVKTFKMVSVKYKEPQSARRSFLSLFKDMTEIVIDSMEDRATNKYRMIR